jgi:hypothetical protein
MGVSTRNPRDLAALASRSADTVGIVKRACASFYRSLRTFSAFGRGCSRDAIANFGIGLKGILAITRTIARYRRQKCG